MPDENHPDSFDVLVYGMIGVHYLLEVDDALEPGAARRIKRETRCIGGSAAIAAIALATWGADVCLMGNPVGDGTNSRLILSELATLPNITLRTAMVPGFETPYTVALVAAGAAPTYLVRHEAVEQYLREPFEPGDDYWPPASYGLCDAEFGAQAGQLVRWLRRCKAPILLKGSPAEEEIALGSRAIICTLPTGVPLPTLKRRVRQLSARWKTIVCLLERNSGAGLWSQAGGPVRVFEPPQLGRMTALGRIGMEDVVRAGLLWAEFQGWDWGRGLKFALAAAALKSRRPGIVGSIPNCDEIENAMPI